MRLSSCKVVEFFFCEYMQGVEISRTFHVSYPIFSVSQNPNELEDWLGDFNTTSKEVITGAFGVPPLANAKEGDKFQFERLGGISRLN